MLFNYRLVVLGHESDWVYYLGGVIRRTWIWFVRRSWLVRLVIATSLLLLVRRRPRRSVICMCMWFLVVRVMA